MLAAAIAVATLAGNIATLAPAEAHSGGVTVYPSSTWKDYISSARYYHYHTADYQGEGEDSGVQLNLTNTGMKKIAFPDGGTYSSQRQWATYYATWLFQQSQWPSGSDRTIAGVASEIHCHGYYRQASINIEYNWQNVEWGEKNICWLAGRSLSR